MTPPGPSSVLARLRMPVAEAEVALRRLGAMDGSPDGQVPNERVVDALVGAASPPAALRAFQRLADADAAAWQQLRADSDALRRFGVVAGVSDALADVMVADPTLVRCLVAGLEPRTAEDVHRAAVTLLAALPDGHVETEAGHALARIQRRGVLRIATRDLLGFADTPSATEELTALAAGVVAAALDHVIGHAPDLAGATDHNKATALTVIAMGKLGGHELNYVSDIDVMFVYSGDRVLGTRWASRLLSLLGSMTPLGKTYEVDANLRPEGRDGPLVRTLDGYRSYYQRWAKTWEQQALLKARPLAGDTELGTAFLELVEPFLWPDQRAGDTVSDIQKMKAVVETSSPVQRAGTREVKLAPGGLRDIEFAVQLLQLVHGRHDTSLRSANTLEALRMLAAGGYVDEGDANLFSDAYQFLRTVEHRLQLRALRRTHVIPGSETERYRLARACGFRDLRASSALEQFDHELSRVRANVRQLHQKLFYRPLLDRFAEVSRDETRAVGGGTQGFDDTAAVDRLAALGFHAPGRSIGHLRSLATGTKRSDVLLRTALPMMLSTFAAGPDPDGGLLALRTMAERLEHSPSFLTALRDAPVVGELLATVLSQSRMVGEWLERQPEVFKTLSDPKQLGERLEPAAYRKVALGLVRRGGDDEQIAAALRRFKRREVARIAVRDLTGRAEPDAVAAELTGLADACLEAALTAVTAQEDLRLAVIGLGKLGGRELGYASDLDIIIVFEPAGARKVALQAVERLLRMLSSITPEGQAFAVDLKLRPEGTDGPMARTLKSSVRYYEQWAQPWELFALTQARVAAGDTELGAEFINGIRPQVWPARVSDAYVRDIRTMKARIERERDSSLRREQVDVKLGAGGLSDIEWTLQLLAVRYGDTDSRIPGTLASIAALATGGVLSGEESVWLRRAWLLLTHIRNARYLSGARHTDRVPMDPLSLERLARMLGYDHPGGQNLTEDLTRAMRRVRRVHERRFYS